MFLFFVKRKDREEYCFATFLEKVAQKAAFRESLIPPGFVPPGWLTRSAQGQFLISLNALRVTEANRKERASTSRSALDKFEPVVLRSLKAVVEA
ncbi:hypothetical protein WCX18_05680 [Sulfurimonas sp. HSL1-2]|uniref:hypothetical protein n=1 Tax=Thiomicrolovo zhangzhouensis TaxID=3131933 RepID=UPI0031F81CA7